MGNVDKLIKKLTDKKAETRKTAIIELGKIGDLRAVDPLIIRLKDNDEDVRLWAAVVLGKLGDERALEPLVKVVMTDTDKVRKEAAGAVVKIVPSFDDVNIDEVIKKIESIYEEFTLDKEREAEQIARQKDLEFETEKQLEKKVQEKYFEELQKAQKEKAAETQPEPPLEGYNDQSSEKTTEIIEKETRSIPEDTSHLPPPAIQVPGSRKVVESIEKEKNGSNLVDKQPEISINEFMSALKKGTVEERLDELSDVLARVMNLFVNAIDDISMRLNNLETKMEQKFQVLQSKPEGVPAIMPSLKKVPATQNELKAPTSIAVLPTRAALNEELKKVLNQRKIEG
ncbi:MAG: HEAT repeat domain-containing protein [Candidatus Helarchaeota archaeon]